MKAYITKYALTRGIIEINTAEICTTNETMLFDHESHIWYGFGDWFKTFHEAQRNKKIKQAVANMKN